MESFFQPIASSPTLQGIAILVTLGTLVFYLLKYGWRALLFLKDILTGKWKVAVSRIMRVSIKRALIDYVDARLITISMSMLSLIFGFLILQILIVCFGLLSISSITKIDEINLSWPNGIFAIIGGILTGIAIGSFLLFGVFRHLMTYLFYVRMLRRKILQLKPGPNHKKRRP